MRRVDTARKSATTGSQSGSVVLDQAALGTNRLPIVRSSMPSAVEADLKATDERLFSSEGKAQRRLVQLASDVVYEAYSTALQLTSDHVRMDKAVEVPEELLDNFRGESRARLLALMRLVEVPPDESSSDGKSTFLMSDEFALNRGRRIDRPLAQIVREVSELVAEEVQQRRIRLKE